MRVDELKAVMVPPNFADKSDSLIDLLANAALVSDYLDHQSNDVAASFDERNVPVEARIDSRINQLNLDLEKELNNFPFTQKRNSGWSDRFTNALLPTRNRALRKPLPAHRKCPSPLICLSISLLIVLIIVIITLALIYGLPKGF
ncbi:hypothetical protein L0F63_002138 [Massospora cicadina]|nr:hypothetical protein L0F63_002138 [Massospora cicadina]